MWFAFDVYGEDESRRGEGAGGGGGGGDGGVKESCSSTTRACYLYFPPSVAVSRTLRTGLYRLCSFQPVPALLSLFYTLLRSMEDAGEYLCTLALCSAEPSLSETTADNVIELHIPWRTTLLDCSVCVKDESNTISPEQ